MEINTVDELRAAYPELTAQIADEATAAERERIRDIEGVALPGFEGIISRAKFEATATAAEVATLIVAKVKEQGAAYLASVSEDEKKSGIKDVTAGGHEGGADGEDPYLAAVDAVMPKTN